MSRQQEMWNSACASLDAFYKTHNRKPKRTNDKNSNKISEEENKLGRFISTQIEEYKKGTLSKEKYNCIIKIDKTIFDCSTRSKENKIARFLNIPNDTFVGWKNQETSGYKEFHIVLNHLGLDAIEKLKEKAVENIDSDINLSASEKRKLAENIALAFGANASLITKSKVWNNKDNYKFMLYRIFREIGVARIKKIIKEYNTLAKQTK